MYTQCPECLTIFRVGAATVAQARARARCGVCRVEFDMLHALADQLPADPGELLPQHHGGALPTLEVPLTRTRLGQRDLFADSRERSVAPPTFASPRPAQRRRGNWIWHVGSVALLVLAIGQAGFAYRQELFQDARVRPWLDSICARIDCRLPPRRDVDQLALVSRDVRPHPSVPGALMISATVLNKAAFTQPYPTVEIVMSDLEDRKIAMRRFQPQDYVDSLAVINRGMPTQSTSAMNFEVLDPGKNAVAFEFRFR